MSLADRVTYRAFLTQPIARQALLVVVPKYDRVAPVLIKPVRLGLRALAEGSLLQNYALAIAIARLMESPVEQAVAVLIASDSEGREQVRSALRSWPRLFRRRIDVHYRRLCECADDPGDDNARRRVAGRRAVSKTPSRSVSRIPNRSLKNPDSNGLPKH